MHLWFFIDGILLWHKEACKGMMLVIFGDSSGGYLSISNVIEDTDNFLMNNIVI
jgi:hypothetical protein